MFVVDKYTKNILLTRGDSAELVVSLADSLGIPYEMGSDDTLVFSMVNEIGDKDVLLRKEIKDSNVFKFIPDDTNKLPFGKYFYDIQLTTADGEVYTVVPPSSFVVGEEVTE